MSYTRQEDFPSSNTITRLPSDLQLYSLSADRAHNAPYIGPSSRAGGSSSGAQPTAPVKLDTHSTARKNSLPFPPVMTAEELEDINQRTWTPGELHRLRRNYAIKAAAVAGVRFEEEATRLAKNTPPATAHKQPRNVTALVELALGSQEVEPDLPEAEIKRLDSRVDEYVQAINPPELKASGSEELNDQERKQPISPNMTSKSSRSESNVSSISSHVLSVDDTLPTKPGVVIGLKDPAVARSLSEHLPPTKEEAAATGPAQKIDVNEVDPAILNTPVREGLSTKEVEERRVTYGFNELPEKKTNPFLKFLSYFTGSIAYLIEAACILSAALQDWTDFGIILALLIVNACIGFFEEARAESAVEALRNTLALKSKVIRDGKMEELPSRELLPGDIVSLRLGDVVPADCKLLGLSSNFEETHHEMSIDQSALTGESLPVSKLKGDSVWSGTIVKQGQSLAVVTHIGEKTFLGRAAHLIATTEDSGHFQQVITRIGNFIIAITLTMVVIILIVAVARGEDFLTNLEYALVLTIASIPVGLPTVLSVTMAVGSKQLAAKQVIVKRLTAVEEMAGLRILCSDKTGTLTLNQLSVDEPYLAPSRTNEDLLLAAFLASEPGANDAIELCVRTEALSKVGELAGVELHTANIPNYRCIQFQPFDPVSKLTRAVIHKLDTDEIFCVAKGAPQVILKLCSNASVQADKAIVSMARRGFRALGVARSRPLPHGPGEATAPTSDTVVHWELVGLLSLLDPPRPDSQSTIEHCAKFGIDVKMITGDAVLIAKEVAKRLGMNRNILHPSKLQGDDEKELIRHCVRADGFAQVVPEDKFRVVELLQKEGYMVGMTGDGVNDAPALKKANVGIAVHGCTDAARSAADIVLLQPGLSTIVDGIITSRQIFQRMRSYAVYRITSTVHFMIFMFFAILCLNWTLPPRLIVLIALLNDAATIVISVDNAKISKRPDKWRLGQMLTLSVVLGLLLTGASFAHYFIANNVFNVSRDELDTILYLQMSSCPHFVIFSTRLSVPFWKRPPSLVFFIAIAGTQVFAMFISIYGVIAAPIGWAWGASVMAISVAYFIFMDWVKCEVYKRWNFELTAILWPSKERRDKLKMRKAEQIKLERVRGNVAKAKRVVTMIKVARAWGKGDHYHPLPEAEMAMPIAPHH